MRRSILTFLGGVLLAGALVTTVAAQPGPFSAQIQAALRALGLTGIGFITGDCAGWDATLGKWVPTVCAGGGGGGAPTNATYITQTSNAGLSAEQALASLSSGIMRVATTTGVVTSLTDCSGIAANQSDETGTCGGLVLSVSPSLTTPTLGVASATSINKVAITAPATSATLTLADGSTLATSGAFSTTFTATGATSLTLPTSGNLMSSSGVWVDTDFACVVGTTGLAFVDCGAKLADFISISGIVQGDLIYGSGANTVAMLAKDANATRYLSNTGTTNNPAWAQVNLSNGVTGDLPFANFTQASAASKLLGRGSASGAGDYEEITLGSGLTMTGTTLSASGTGSPGGSDTQVQYNNAGAFGGSADLIWNNTTKALTIGATGVSFTTDNDGAITLRSVSAGSQEDWNINLDDTANTIVSSSSTGVDQMTWSSIRQLYTTTQAATQVDAFTATNTSADGRVRLVLNGNNTNAQLILNSGHNSASPSLIFYNSIGSINAVIQTAGTNQSLDLGVSGGINWRIVGSTAHFVPATTNVSDIGTASLIVRQEYVNQISLGANLLLSVTAPTVSSGFGASPSISGTAASFRVNVGTGGTATGGVLTMPTAATGWNCHVENLTGTAANRADQRTVQMASTTASVTIQNQTVSTGAALAWTASDVVSLVCAAY